MNINLMINKYNIFTLAILIAALDQAVKIEVVKNIGFFDSIPILGGSFNLVKTHNTGAAFSLLEGQVFFLSLLSIFALIITIIYIVKLKGKIPAYLFAGFGFLIGGTVGNLIDRLFVGYVIDYIKPEFINFPVFNIADIAINVGAAILIIGIIIKDKEEN